MVNILTKLSPMFSFPKPGVVLKEAGRKQGKKYTSHSGDGRRVVVLEELVLFGHVLLIKGISYDQNPLTYHTHAHTHTKSYTETFSLFWCNQKVISAMFTILKGSELVGKSQIN